MVGEHPNISEKPFINIPVSYYLDSLDRKRKGRLVERETSISANIHAGFFDLNVLTSL